MKVLTVRVDDIEVGGRHRAVSDQDVARLASSMNDIGLCQPITIRIIDEMIVDGELCAGVPILVAGAHRLAAAKSLGWEKIDCIEVEDDLVKAEMWEIAENLHRCDLTKDERDKHIRRYAELLTAQRQSRQGVAIESKREDGRGHRVQGVAREVADATGVSVRTAQRALNPPAPRAPQILKPVVEPEAEHDAIIRAANKIIAAWNAAPIEARELAMAEMDGAVFDKTPFGKAI